MLETRHSARRVPPFQSMDVITLLENLHFVDACRDEHFEAMSLIHALGWRDTYVGYVPDEYMAREITDDRWVKFFREDYETGRCHGLLLYRNNTPVGCINHGPARNQEPGCEDFGEIISFYTHPAERGNGYGGQLMEEAVRRLGAAGHKHAYVYVLKENEKARRFYTAHGFAWDGTHTLIPFPPDAICVDLRYTREI